MTATATMKRIVEILPRLKARIAGGFKSTLLPRALGVLMAIAGLSYLTYLSPALVKYLFPYNLAPRGDQAILAVFVASLNGREQRWTVA